MSADPSKRFHVEFFSSGRTPSVPPNPKYPEGIDVDGSGGAAQACSLALPYPAPCCGIYNIRCKLCGLTAALTTAGRPDDPRSLKLPCKAIAGEAAGSA